MIGRVTSTKMQKTAVVLIERVARHPIYKKTFKRSKKYLVDDPVGCKDGDLVEIIKIAPISKNKHWRIAKVVGKNLSEIAKEKLKVAAEEIIAEVMPEKPEESVGQSVSESAGQIKTDAAETPTKTTKKIKVKKQKEVK